MYKIDNIDEDGCLGSTPHYFRIGESLLLVKRSEVMTLLFGPIQGTGKMGNLTTVILAWSLERDSICCSSDCRTTYNKKGYICGTSIQSIVISCVFIHMHISIVVIIMVFMI